MTPQLIDAAIANQRQVIANLDAAAQIARRDLERAVEGLKDVVQEREREAAHLAHLETWASEVSDAA